MKTSTTYLLAALLVLLASLTAYNMALRAEYRSGAYKDPLRSYEQLAFQNFTAVAVPAASVLNVKIVAGPFGVRLNPATSKLVRVRQQGQQLLITAAFPAHVESLGWGETVVVSCPRLLALTTSGEYELNGQPHHDKSDAGRRVLVQGFRQDSLHVYQDLASRVELTGNQLGFLRAVAGPTPGSHATLQLNPGNQIADASLDIDHQSELLITDTAIPRLRYRFGDSAKVTLTGKALAQVPR